MAKKMVEGQVLVNPHVLISRIKLHWPFVVWLLAAALAVLVYLHGGQFGGMTGSVFTGLDRVAPMDTGRLEQLFVDVGDAVKKGDLLAQMDASMLEAEKALYEAQVSARHAELKEGQVQNLRRFDSAAVRLESELRNLRMRQAGDQGELQAAMPEFQRLEKLLASKLVDEQSMMPLRMKIRELELSVKTYPEMIKQVEAELSEARRQKAEIELQSRSAAGLIDAEAREQIKLFEMRIEACRLRAREDGTVSRIYHYPGGIVPGGDEVLASVLTGEPKVVGFLSEYNARDVIPGMQAYLTPVSGHGPVIRATVMALTPEILSLPGRVSPTPSQTYRGRRVVLMPEPGCDLLPGEEVQIHFSRPWNIRMLWDVFKRRGEKAE